MYSLKNNIMWRLLKGYDDLSWDFMIDGELGKRSDYIDSYS